MMSTAPPERLAAFRVLSGGFALGYLLVRLPYLLDVIHLDARRWDPPGALAGLSRPLTPGLAQGLLVLTLVSGLAFVVGWRYRITGPAFGLLLLGVLSYRNSWGHLFHTDNLLVLHVLIVGTAPAAAAWSLDARRAPVDPATSAAPSVRFGWPLRLAALVTVLTYVVTGIAKLRYAGGDWLGGDTLLHQIAFDNARKKVLGASYSPLATAFAGHPGLFRPMGALTLVVELGAPLALLGRRWAWVWTGSAWVLHLGILALMAIGFPYPLSLIAFAPLFALERPVEALRDRRSLRRVAGVDLGG
jgi:hypothetical protein